MSFQRVQHPTRRNVVYHGLAVEISDGDPAAFIDERRASTVVGTVDEVRERLAEYEEAGVERIMLQHLDHGDLGTVALLGSL